MATKMRLARVGAKNKPRWRIVVVEEGKKRDGKVIETLGFVDSRLKPPKLNVNHDRVKFWLEKGARFSAGLSKLLT